MYLVLGSTLGIWHMGSCINAALRMDSRTFLQLCTDLTESFYVAYRMHIFRSQTSSIRQVYEAHGQLCKSWLCKIPCVT